MEPLRSLLSQSRATRPGRILLSSRSLMVGKRKSILPHVVVNGTKEDDICAGMYKLTPECWIGSNGPQICAEHFHPGRAGPAPGVLNHQDDDEGEDEELFPASFLLTMGCDDAAHQADETRWLSFHSETPTSSGLPGSHLPSQHQTTGGNHVETMQDCVGCCCEGQEMQTSACVGVYGQIEREGLNPCWSGSPSNYYIVRRNMVVEVEVVEEVAVEDTVELMTDDLYAEGLLDVEFVQSEQLYPP